MHIEYVASPPPQVVYVPMPPTEPIRTSSGPRPGLVATLVMAAVVAASAGLFVALLGPTVVRGEAIAPPQPYRTLTIEYDFYDDSRYNWADCSGGEGAYSDIRPGMQLTIRDQSGDIVESTALPTDGTPYPGGYGCVWTMTVDVPANVQHLSIGNTRRGEVTYDRDELVRNGWTAGISLGYS